MQKHNLHDVFTPSRPARISFVEREVINRRIVRALKTPGTQIVIYGHTGSGKTTLLENKLFQLYEKHIRTNCMKGMTFDAIVIDAFDQLSEFYIDEKTNLRKSKIDAGLQISYKEIKSQIALSNESSAQIVERRILPPQLTAQALARFIGEAGYCWVVEDFHKIENGEKLKLAQLMKVFMDMSDKHEDLKIIAIGAVNTAREVVNLDKEMRKRVSEIHVPLMDDEEIKEIIRKGSEALNLKVSTDIENDITHYSNGLAAICHKLCLLMCEEAGITETVTKEAYEFDYEDLKGALTEYLADESDTIKCAFDKSLRLHNIENSIRALSNADRNGSTLDDIYEYFKRNHLKVTKEKLESGLKDLEKEENGAIVKFDEDSHKYSFSDPFLRTFSLAFFDEKDRALQTNRKLTDDQIRAIINQAFKAVVADVQTDQPTVIAHIDPEPHTE